MKTEKYIFELVRVRVFITEIKNHKRIKTMYYTIKIKNFHQNTNSKKMKKSATDLKNITAKQENYNLLVFRNIFKYI